MSWAFGRMIKAATTKHSSTSTSVGPHDVQPQREKHDRRILLKERSSPYHHVVWTTMASLMRPHRKRSRRLPPAYSVTNYIHRILLDQLSGCPKILGPISHYRIADILPHEACVESFLSWARCFLRILCNGLCTAQGFHAERCVVHDVRMNPTPSPTTTNALLLYDMLISYWEQASVLLCFH